MDQLEGALLTLAGEFSPDFLARWQKHAKAATPRLLNFVNPYRVHIALIPPLAYVVKGAGLESGNTIPYAIITRRWEAFEVEFTTGRGYRSFLASHGLRYAVPPEDLKRLLLSGQLQEPE